MPSNINFGHKIIYLDQVDSTNNYATILYKEGKISSGTVILADEQTAGKGQRGASWSSQAGFNMLFSLYIEPDNLSIQDQTLLNYFVTLCLVEILRKIGISASIKWPNDIYVSDKKIAGVLIENSIKENKVQSSIIGIGLNVNQSEFENLNATSVKNEVDQAFSITELVFMLLDQFRVSWMDVEFSKKNKLKNEYLENLYLFNEEAIYEDSQEIFQGKIIDISDDGLVVIQKKEGVETYGIKEVKLVGRNNSLNSQTSH